MGRSPCCDENTGLKKGPWTPEEDDKLVEYIQQHGHGSWRALPKLAGLNRCGKSCRLRWTNYLRPDIKRGKFSQDEEQTILNLHAILGNKWSAIASHLPGRTDNEIKNFWNTHLKKKLIQMGFDPMTHRPRTDIFTSLPHLIALANLKELMDHPCNWEEQAVRSLQTEAVQMARLQYLQFLLQPSQGAASNSINENIINTTTNQFLMNNNMINTTDDHMDTINLLNSLSSFKDINQNPLGISSNLSDPIANFSNLPDLQIPCESTTTPHDHQLPPLTVFPYNNNNNNNNNNQEDQNSPNSCTWFPNSSSTTTTATPSPPNMPHRHPNINEASMINTTSSCFGEIAPSIWSDFIIEDSLFNEIS